MDAPQVETPGGSPSDSPEEPRAERSKLRRRTCLILEVDRFGDRLSALVDKCLVGLIVLNVLASVVQTIEPVYAAAPWLFEGFEALSIVVFGLEYLLRLWSCVELDSYRGGLVGRVRFALQPMMLLDLVVLVVPLWFDLRPLRVLRLLRLGRYSSRLRLFGRILTEKREELFVGVFVALVLLIACSTAMYYLERDSNEAFGSIPATMWWGVATLTTVGYGDVYPTTDAGKLLGALVALLGIGVFALPAGILASGFSEAIEREREALREAEGAGHPPLPESEAAASSRGTCPACGASIRDAL